MPPRGRQRAKQKGTSKAKGRAGGASVSGEASGSESDVGRGSRTSNRRQRTATPMLKKAKRIATPRRVEKASKISKVSNASQDSLHEDSFLMGDLAVEGAGEGDRKSDTGTLSGNVGGGGGHMMPLEVDMDKEPERTGQGVAEAEERNRRKVSVGRQPSGGGGAEGKLSVAGSEGKVSVTRENLREQQEERRENLLNKKTEQVLEEMQVIRVRRRGCVVPLQHIIWLLFFGLLTALFWFLFGCLWWIFAKVFGCNSDKMTLQGKACLTVAQAVLNPWARTPENVYYPPPLEFNVYYRGMGESNPAKLYNPIKSRTGIPELIWILIPFGPVLALMHLLCIVGCVLFAVTIPLISSHLRLMGVAIRPFNNGLFFKKEDAIRAITTKRMMTGVSGLSVRGSTSSGGGASGMFLGRSSRMGEGGTMKKNFWGQDSRTSARPNY